MLPRENVKIWAPEWLKIQCGPCTCSRVTATRIKGLPTGMFLRVQSEFRCRNGWKYRILCRFISYKFRCRKFPAARCRLSPCRSPRVAVSRPCRLSEFTPYRALHTHTGHDACASHMTSFVRTSRDAIGRHAYVVVSPLNCTASIKLTIGTQFEALAPHQRV